MASHVEIQLGRAPADVTILPQGDAARAGTPAGQAAEGGQGDPQQMQRQLEVELAAVRSARAALEDAAGKLRELQQRFPKEAEEELLNLSIEIARKVLMQEIESARHKVDPIVKQALSEIPTGVEVAVRLNPDDLSRCGLAEADGQIDGRTVRFVSDPAVKGAECRLETSQGTIESSIEGHLAEIGEALKNQE